MGSPNSLSVRKDFSGKVSIDGREITCFLYQAGGILVVFGNEDESILEALARSAKLDIDPAEWELGSRKEGEDETVFYKK